MIHQAYDADEDTKGRGIKGAFVSENLRLTYRSVVDCFFSCPIVISRKL